MLRILIASLSLALALPATAADTANVKQPVKQADAPKAASVKQWTPPYHLLPAGHDTALLVADAASGKTLYKQRADKLQPPASIQKLLTALAAKLYLPSDFRFETTLAQQGNDLVIQFSGDPTLSRKQLAALLKQAKQKGIRTIKGDILLNGNVFNGHEHATGLPWDIQGVCYSAPASSLSLEHNCVQGALYSNRAFGQATRVNVPSHQPITVTSDATVGPVAPKDTDFCELQLDLLANNHYQLSGCLPQRKKPLPLNFAVQDTAAYIGATIQQELKRLGMRLEGSVRRDDNASGKVIARHRSAPLDPLLTTMVQDSDNLIADNLAKTLGARYYQQSGNFSNGTAAIKAILSEKANIDLSHAVLADGSGLSRNNRLTAKQMMAVLTYLHQHDNTLGLLKTLPTSGKTGTLRYRQSLRQAPLAGRIEAKSGSLYGTYNLAGFVKTQSGKTLIVVQMVTNYHPAPAPEGAPPVTPAIQAFETSLYGDLYRGRY
ncbi:serine-type D-Ala-D-Ala carboxypeptidase [Photobacterium japonica]|uniref:serine-type D-Ala-D-Ala carboxypeptidase n=1 Tax=Photobacterium japonica TaxID=2910235 RepID=UPI003D103F92